MKWKIRFLSLSPPLFTLALLFGGLIWAPESGAAYKVKELAAGLKNLIAVVDSGGTNVPHIQNEREMEKALDYFSGAWEAYRFQARYDHYHPEDAVSENIRLVYDALPKEVMKVARDFLAFYPALDHLQDAPAGGFLHAFFIGKYGVTDQSKERFHSAVEGLLLETILKYQDSPESVPEFTAWLEKCKKKQLDDTLDELEQLELNHYLLWLSVGAAEEPGLGDPKRKIADQPIPIEVNGTRILLPSPRPYVRLDGRSSALDQAIETMTKGGGLKAHVVFGSKEDAETAGRGEIPLMQRTIVVNQIEDFPSGIPVEAFAIVRQQLSARANQVDEKLRKHFEGIGKASDEALKDLIGIKSEMKFGEIESLGVFDESETSVCHTMVAHMDTTIGETLTSFIQVTSTATVLVKGEVLSVQANAEFLSEDDLEWTREVAKKMRDELLQLNP